MPFYEVSVKISNFKLLSKTEKLIRTLLNYWEVFTKFKFKKILNLINIITIFNSFLRFEIFSIHIEVILTYKLPFLAWNCFNVCFFRQIQVNFVLAELPQSKLDLACLIVERKVACVDVAVSFKQSRWHPRNWSVARDGRLGGKHRVEWINYAVGWNILFIWLVKFSHTVYRCGINSLRR